MQGALILAVLVPILMVRVSVEQVLAYRSRALCVVLLYAHAPPKCPASITAESRLNQRGNLGGEPVGVHAALSVPSGGPQSILRHSWLQAGFCCPALALGAGCRSDRPRIVGQASADLAARRTRGGLQSRSGIGINKADRSTLPNG